MTKADLIKKLESFPEDTVVVVKDGYGHWHSPVTGYEEVQPIHLSRCFPFYTPEEQKKEVLGKTVIVIS